MTWAASRSAGGLLHISVKRIHIMNPVHEAWPMPKPASTRHRTTNWPDDNASPRRRGSLSIRFDPEAIWHAGRSGKRGRPETSSDAVIQDCLTLKVLFGLPLRQAVGLVGMAGLDWPERSLKYGASASTPAKPDPRPGLASANGCPSTTPSARIRRLEADHESSPIRALTFRRQHDRQASLAPPQTCPGNGDNLTSPRTAAISAPSLLRGVFLYFQVSIHIHATRDLCLPLREPLPCPMII